MANNWKIVGNKFLKGLGLSFLAVGIPYAIDFLANNASLFPEWFIVMIPVVTATLVALENAIQHSGATQSADATLTK